MPIRTPTTSLNFALSAATIKSHAQISIRPAEIALPCTWAMVILRRSPAAGVLEEVVPLLQIGLLRDGIAVGAVDPEAGQLIRPRSPLRQSQLRTQVVAGGGGL